MAVSDRLCACCRLHVALFVNPQYYLRGPFGILFRGSLGHYFTLPLSTLTCIIVTVRCVIVASGPAVAIATDQEGATVNTLWRSHRLAWSDLLRVRLEATKVRHNTAYSLKFDQCAGGTISLPLGALTITEHGYHYQRLAQTLSDTHLSAINHLRAGSAKTPIPAELDIIQQAVPSGRLRPVFGRKDS